MQGQYMGPLLLNSSAESIPLLFSDGSQLNLSHGFVSSVPYMPSRELLLRCELFHNLNKDGGGGREGQSLVRLPMINLFIGIFNSQSNLGIK